MNIKTYIPFYKRNLAVAVPVMLSQLGQVVVQFADTMMVGRLGSEELASVSFASAIFNIGAFFAMGAAIGQTPLVGKKYSQGDHRGSAKLFQNSFVFNILLGLVISGSLLILSLFMDQMGQTPRVAELATPYFRVMLVSLLPVMLFLSFKQFYEGLGNTKIAMIITIASNILNIGLNYILIYGKFGAPELGVLGAAYATLISRMLMPVAFLVISMKNTRFKRYLYFFRKENFSIAKIKELIQVGVPIGTQIFVEQLAFGFTAIMAGWLGAVTLASHQVAMNISTLIFMVLCGLSSATTIRVSHQLGAGNIGDMRKAAHASYQLTMLSNTIFAILIILFRNQIPLLFTNDPEVIAVSSKLFIILAIYLIPDGLQVVSLGALRGLSDVKAPMIYASFAYLGLNIPIGYLCGFVLGMGVSGIWIGFVAGLSAAAVCFIYRFEKKSKQMLQPSSTVELSGAVA